MCHGPKNSGQLFKEQKNSVLDWPGNSPHLNLIKKLWVVLKNKVSEEQPSNLKQLENAIKTIWTCDITSEYRCKCIESTYAKTSADGK